jgi:hypothetical protein
MTKYESKKAFRIEIINKNHESNQISPCGYVVAIYGYFWAGEGEAVRGGSAPKKGKIPPDAGCDPCFYKKL